MIKEKTNGFTLTELLVTVSIITILSISGLITLKGIQKKARDARRIADVTQIQTALEFYLKEHGSFKDIFTADNAVTRHDCSRTWKETDYYSTDNFPSFTANHKLSVLIDHLRPYMDTVPLDPINKFNDWNGGQDPLPNYTSGNLLDGYYWVMLLDRPLLDSTWFCPIGACGLDDNTVTFSYLIETVLEDDKNPNTFANSFPASYTSCILTPDQRRNVMRIYGN